LEFCGYDFIYGRAIWSENSTVRNKVEGGKYNDWRWKPVFSGWDCNLRPILIQGLVLMYLRMGFLILPEFYSENVVAYPSKRFKQIVIKEIGQEAWNEWVRHSLGNRKAWAAIQKERAAKIAPEKREALIREAIRAEEARLRKADREEFPDFPPDPLFLWKPNNKIRNWRLNY